MMSLSARAEFKMAVIDTQKAILETKAGKKAGAKNLGETAEINVFKDDNSVLHFKKPKIEYAVKEKISFITGTPETKRKYFFIYYYY